MPTRLIVQGDLLDFPSDPGFAPPGEAEQGGAVRWRPAHQVRIEAGRIVAVEPIGTPLPEAWGQASVVDHRGHLLMPGFIDTHVHCPQLDVIASFGTELLDWLNTYTFPAERAYADPVVSQAGAERFLSALWGHGTTAAVVFPTVHKVSAEALFERASRVQMRLVTGFEVVNTLLSALLAAIAGAVMPRRRPGIHGRRWATAWPFWPAWKTA